MAILDILQADADALIAMKKIKVNDDIHEYPDLGGSLRNSFNFGGQAWRIHGRYYARVPLTWTKETCVARGFSPCIKLQVQKEQTLKESEVFSVSSLELA